MMKLFLSFIEVVFYTVEINKIIKINLRLILFSETLLILQCKIFILLIVGLSSNFAVRANNEFEIFLSLLSITSKYENNLQYNHKQLDFTIGLYASQNDRGIDAFDRIIGKAFNFGLNAIFVNDEMKYDYTFCLFILNKIYGGDETRQNNFYKYHLFTKSTQFELLNLNRDANFLKNMQWIRYARGIGYDFLKMNPDNLLMLELFAGVGFSSIEINPSNPYLVELDRKENLGLDYEAGLRILFDMKPLKIELISKYKSILDNKPYEMIDLNALISLYRNRYDMMYHGNYVDMDEIISIAIKFDYKIFIIENKTLPIVRAGILFRINPFQDFYLPPENDR